MESKKRGKKKRKVGLIGCGTIGSEIAVAIDSSKVNAELVAVYDAYMERAYTLVNRLNTKPMIADSIDALLASDTELIVEAASQQAVKDYAKSIVEHGKDIMLMSVGALLDDMFYAELCELLERHGRTLYLPTGAIAGIDAIRSVRHMLKEVTLTTTKHPRALMGAPFFKEHRVNLNGLKKARVIYRGYAREAVRLFPANVNVAAILSIAGVGADKTKVRIVADPRARRNIHEIHAKGEFGELYFKVSNLPSPSNPKTSYLAVLSAIECLSRACDGRVSIGT
ncbi:MAG: aspartate dehydrogenase [Candidatus Nitrosocaldus sp.]